MQNAARLLLSLSLVVLLVAPAIEGRAAAVLFVLASLLVPGTLLVSSAPVGRDPQGRVTAAVALTIVLESGAAALLLGARFPVAAWIMLGLLGFVPLAIVPAIHALRVRGGPDRP